MVQQVFISTSFTYNRLYLVTFSEKVESAAGGGDPESLESEGRNPNSGTRGPENDI